MKIKLFLLLTAVSVGWFIFLSPAPAQTSPRKPALLLLSGPLDQYLLLQLSAVEKKINAKIRDDAMSFQQARENEKDFAPELQALDALLTAHKGEKSDAVARILQDKASLYGICHEPEVCDKVLKQVIQDYPGTYTARATAIEMKPGDNTTEFVALRRNLIHQLVGQPAPNFQVKDLGGQLQSLAAYRGKVLLVSFGSMNCAPCLEEIPNIAKIYAQYGSQGLEVLGVSEDREEAKPKLGAFVKARNISWPVCSDEYSLSQLFYEGALPDNYLISRDGKIIGMDLLGKDLDAAVAKALAAK